MIWRVALSVPRPSLAALGARPDEPSNLSTEAGAEQTGPEAVQSDPFARALYTQRASALHLSIDSAAPERQRKDDELGGEAI